MIELQPSPARASLADLFDDVHNRMSFQNKISNTLVAIGLYERNPKNPSLAMYLSDGIKLCNDAVVTLQQMLSRQETSAQVPFSKLFVDISLKQTGTVKRETLVQFKSNFERVMKTLESIEHQKDIKSINDDTKKAKLFLLTLDKEVRATYDEQDKVYFGYFGAGRPI